MMQDIFIIGATGRVGSTLVRQLFSFGDCDRNIHPNPTRIIGMCSSKTYLLNSSGISYDVCVKFIKQKGGGNHYEDLKEIVDQIPLDQSVTFIDVTSSHEMLSFHLHVITQTNHRIVTANKNPLALCDLKTFNTLVNMPARYGFRCSVMAGAEAVSFLQDLRDVRDVPVTVEGCFSGTLNYLCSASEQGLPFSQIVSDAVEKGYTEPHPRDDLNGVDVARKLLILARTAGFAVSMEDISLEPFIPDSYLKEDTVEAFTKRLKRLDDEIEARMKQLEARGMTLRYVAAIHNEGDLQTVQCSLSEVPRESPLGRLKGTLNKIVVTTKSYKEDTPYSVEAPGAGLAVTAQNIRRDLLHQLESRKHCG